MTIPDLEARLRRLVEVLTEIGLGRHDLELVAGDDALGAVESGVNDLVLDLQTLHLANREKADYLELQQRLILDKERRLGEQAEALAVQRATIEEQQVLLASRARELEEMMATIRSQTEAIRELNVPIIEVEDGVVALPLIGAFDSSRAQDVMATLLSHVAGHGSRHVILDLTGVGVIDTHTAAHLEKLVRAVQLLGARCVICGLQPETARTLVELGADLRAVQTFRNLKEGLRDSLHAAAPRPGEARAANTTRKRP